MAVALVSCTDNELGIDLSNIPYADYIELHERIPEVKIGTPKSIAQMEQNDIIVSVNGYPMTRRDWDDRVAMETQFLLKKAGANNFQVEEQIKDIKARMVGAFVTKRLLIDDAKARNVQNPTSVFNNVNAYIAANAKAKKKTIRQFEALYPGDRKYLYYDVAERIWIDALVATNIPPEINVDAYLVSNAQAMVDVENAKIAATNALKKAQLAKWKTDIEEGRAKFEDLAAQYSSDADDVVGTNGYWCIVERGEMSDKKLQAIAFALPMGKISDPVEDENGIHLIKVNKITPPEKNSKGRTIRNEVRELAHIYLEKEPEILRQSDTAMRHDLKRQIQLQAIEKYVDILKTNGQNTVVFPHGKNLL